MPDILSGLTTYTNESLKGSITSTKRQHRWARNYFTLSLIHVFCKTASHQNIFSLHYKRRFIPQNLHLSVQTAACLRRVSTLWYHQRHIFIWWRNECCYIEKHVKATFFFKILKILTTEKTNPNIHALINILRAKCKQKHCLSVVLNDSLTNCQKKRAVPCRKRFDQKQILTADFVVDHWINCQSKFSWN